MEPGVESKVNKRFSTMATDYNHLGSFKKTEPPPQSNYVRIPKNEDRVSALL